MLLSFSFGFMRSFAIWALLILAACGEVKAPEPMADANVEPPVDTSDGIKSGTRLKVRWADFDGIKSFVSLFDTTRNEACMPRKFADGKTYCIPPAANVVFLDASCTMPIGFQPGSCLVPQTMYYVENDSLTCDNLPKKVYSRGAAISRTSYYNFSTRLGCVNTQVVNNGQLFAITEVPLTELVAMEEEPISAAPGRIQQRFLTSVDGARIFSSVYDTELEIEASLVQDASRGSARGVPPTTPIGDLFGDASCTQSRISSPRGCPLPKYARRNVPTCSFSGVVPQVFKVGVQANPSSIFTNSSGTCQMQTPSTTVNYYEVGTESLTLGTFTRSPTTEGTGRFRKIYYSDGTSKILDPSLFDTTRQTECAPTTLADGTMRCMPINTYSVDNYFSDAACNTPLRLVEVKNAPAPGCTLPPLPKYTTAINTMTCERQVSALGQPIVGTVYTLISGVCQPAPLPNSTLYSLNAVSLDDFSAATITNE